MKALALLALTALATFPLATFPLSAHEHGREPRRVVVVEAPRCAPYPRWEARRHYERWEHRGYGRDWDRRDDRVYFRPLARPLDPPCGARVELRFH